MDVRQQYPIAPLFQGDLAQTQTVCTRLSLCDPQNMSGGESGNEAKKTHMTANEKSYLIINEITPACICGLRRVNNKKLNQA